MYPITGISNGGIYFKYKKEQLTRENVFLKAYFLLKAAHPDWTETQLHDEAFRRQREDEYLQGTEDDKFQEKVKHDLNTTFGIVSLSRIPTDLLMWAHYSKRHTGFCIGIDIRYVFKNFGPKLNLAEMIYRVDLPEIDLFENPVIFYAKLLGTKSTHWKYEQELRLVRRGFVRRELHITTAAIKEVYLGAEMPFKNKYLVIETMKAQMPNVKVFDCVLSNERFEVATMRVH